MDTERNDDYFKQNRYAEKTEGTCSGCGKTIPSSLRHKIRLEKNIWGIPVGTELCGICYGQRTFQLKERGLYTGNPIDPIPHSEIDYRRLI